MISVVPKVAFSDATRMSQHAANASPAPSAGPLIAPITGTAQSVIAHIASRAGRAGSVTSVAVRFTSRLADRAQVDAGHERAISRRGEDDDAHISVVVEREERVAQLGEGRVVDRVHGRAIECDGRDVLGDVDTDAAHAPQCTAARCRAVCYCGGVVRSYIRTAPSVVDAKCVWTHSAIWLELPPAPPIMRPPTK